MTVSRRARRLPAGPLIAAAAQAARARTRAGVGRWETPGSVRDIADVLGVDRRQVDRWAAHGVRVHDADRLACRRLGVHPAAVWGADWWAIPDTKKEPAL